MKTTIIIALALFLTGCAIPSNPKLSFGKKCQVSGSDITYSYVWLFDKQQGLKASEAQCVHLPKKGK